MKKKELLTFYHMDKSPGYNAKSSTKGVNVDESII